MKHHNKNQKIFLSYLFVVIWLFILSIIAYPIYQDIILKNEERSSVQSELANQSERLYELQKVHELIQNQDDELFQRIENLSQEFQEFEIFEHIHDYTRTLPWRPNVLALREIRFWWTDRTDTWFSRTTVDLSLVVSNEATLFNFFQYLTDDTERFRFYIPSFSYDLWNLEWSFAVQVPLTLYHR